MAFYKFREICDTITYFQIPQFKMKVIFCVKIKFDMEIKRKINSKCKLKKDLSL